MSGSIRALRRRTITGLRRLFSTRMRESGFKTGPIGNSRPMKLWAPRNRAGEITPVSFNGFALTEFWGFSEDGVIVDAYGGACVTQPLSSFPTEDLVLLHRWALRKLRPSGGDK